MGRGTESRGRRMCIKVRLTIKLVQGRRTFCQNKCQQLKPRMFWNNDCYMQRPIDSAVQQKNHLLPDLEPELEFFVLIQAAPVNEQQRAY